MPRKPFKTLASIALLGAALFVSGCSDSSDDAFFQSTGQNGVGSNNGSNNVVTVQNKLDQALSFIADGNSADYVSARDLLAGLVDRTDATQAQLDEIHFLYSLTQILAVGDLRPSAVNGLQRVATYRTLGTLLTAFGFDTTHRAGPGDLRPPHTFPNPTPTGDDLRDFVDDPIRQALEGAIDQLSQISPSFQATFTINLNLNGGPPVHRTISVDYGDAVALRAFNRISLAFEVQVASFDLGGNYATFLNGSPRDVETFLKDYPNAFTQVDTTFLGEARTQYSAAIDDINTAAQAIATRSPNGQHLINVSNPLQAQALLARLPAAKAALTQSTALHSGDGSTATLNLPSFFTNGLSPRPFFPDFSGDRVVSLFHGVPFGNVYSGYTANTASDPNLDMNHNNVPDILEHHP